MNIISARPSFSTARKLAIVSLAFWMAASPVLACGPEYDPRDDMYTSYHYDPASSVPINTNYLFEQFIVEGLEKAQREQWRMRHINSRRGDRDYFAELNSALKQAGRAISLVDPSARGAITERSEIQLVLKSPSEYDAQYAGLRPFMLAVIRDKSLSDETAADLMYKRDLLYKTYKSKIKDFISENLTATENDYERYLLAAAYFYMEDYAQAKPIFTQLAKEDDFPLAEASLYSLARLERSHVETPIQAIYNANGEADRAIQERAYVQANRDAGNRAYQAYQTYLKHYPDGQYAREADGMLRRCLWLDDRWEEYVAILKQHADANFKETLATPEWTHDEIEKLMALMEEYQYASRMRTGELDRSEEDRAAKLSALNPLDLVFPSALRYTLKPEGGKQRSILRLYDYLDTLAAYHKGDSAAVINKYGERHLLVGMNNPERLLYVRALEQDKQYDKAFTFWKLFDQNYREDPSLSNNADLEMARIVVMRDGIKGLFTMDVIEDRIKLNYLATLCDEKQQLEWLKDTAINDANKHLLFADIATRYLYQQRLKELHALYQQYPDSLLQEFSGIRTALKQVNDGQSLGKAYMNIGYFMKVSPEPLYLIPEALRKEVADTCQQTIADGAAGSETYFNLAAAQFGEAKDDAEAKLLHFLTLCGKGGEEGRSCWGVVKGEGISSEQAFKKLHQKYPGSKWAEQTPYHY